MYIQYLRVQFTSLLFDAAYLNTRKLFLLSGIVNYLMILFENQYYFFFIKIKEIKRTYITECIY